MLTGLSGLCGTTPTWWASASAAIFLPCVIPPAMQTSGRTYWTAFRARSISNSQIVWSRSPVAIGMWIFARDLGHRVEVVGQDRVLEEEGVVLLDPSREDDASAGVEPSVDLDAEVDLVADRLAIPARRSSMASSSCGSGS